MRLTELEERVLERIRPKPGERDLLLKAYERIKSVIDEILREHGVDAEVTLQGSVAHDTWLSGERDLDVFVLFPREWSVEELRSKGFKILLEAAKLIGKYSLRYAEHPYVKVELDGVEADLVPAFRVEGPGDIRTAVDRTPLHTKFINDHLGEELRDHVRLLKRFLKGLGIYGAEVRVKGFSGYLSELLIINYGGFRELLEEASRWKAPVRVETINDPDVFRLLSRKYPDSVMYVPDPVDPGRNVAAAVSLYSLVSFVVASKCYLVKPCMEYYFPRIRSIDLDFSFIDNRCMVLIVFRNNTFRELSPDVIWGELGRVADRAVKLVQRFGFNVMDWSTWTDEMGLAVIGIEADMCSKEYPKLYTGPPYHAGRRVIDFISKHVLKGSIGPWIRRDGTLVALGARKYSSISELLHDRAWEYLVAPHFRGSTPEIHVLGEEPLNFIQGVDEGWLKDFLFKRRDWIDCCTI